MKGFRTFSTLREALCFTDKCIFARGDVHGAKQIVGGPPPDDTAIVVLAAMNEVGCPFDEPAGEAMFEWARGDESELGPESSNRAMLTLALENAEVLERPPKHVFGRRVHRIGDRFLVTLVVDPDPNDSTIIYGSRKDAIAVAVAAGLLVEGTMCEQKSPEDDAQRQASEMLRLGCSLAEVDNHLATALGVAKSSVPRYRKRWGLVGAPGSRTVGTNAIAGPPTATQPRATRSLSTPIRSRSQRRRTEQST